MVVFELLLEVIVVVDVCVCLCVICVFGTMNEIMI